MKRSWSDEASVSRQQQPRKRAHACSRDDATEGPVCDVTVLSNYLAGNPLVDWLEKHGAKHGLQRQTRPRARSHAPCAQQLAWLRRHLKDSIVNAWGDRAQTLRALRAGAALVLNPALTCAAEKLAVRPHALLAESAWVACAFWEATDGRGAAEAEGDCGGTGGAVARYLVVHCLPHMASPTAWRQLKTRGTVLAHCAIAHLALRDITDAPGDGDRNCEEEGEGESRVRIMPADGALAGIVLGRPRPAAEGEEPTLCIGHVRCKDTHRGLIECRKAAQWVRDLRAGGHEWTPFRPARWEMTPNLRAQPATSNGWEHVLRSISARVGEMTQLYYCSQDLKRRAFALGHRTYHDLLHSTLLTPLQRKIVWANHRDNRDAAIEPRRLRSGGAAAHTLRRMLETPWFATDFETVQDGDAHWIFMIATELYVPSLGTTVAHQATLRNFTHDEQEELLRSWLQWIEAQARAHGVFAKSISATGTADARARVLHWAPAEPRFLASVRRTQIEHWRGSNRNDRVRQCTELHERLESCLQWVDLMAMFVDEKITVPGAFDYKLKSVAKALHRAGQLETIWDDADGAVLNGYSAMCAARQIYAKQRTRHQHESALANIQAYNRVDTRVLIEIARFLQRRVN